jgi:hypothetical protein
MISVVCSSFSWMQNIGRIDAPESFARLTIPVVKNSVRPRNRIGMSLCPTFPSPELHTMAFCFNLVRRALVNARELELGR